ncbi:MAG: phytoene/squalene synthase family protein [Crocinitomicaceae bacterium]|jgi:phytoene/squalene synthetase|nr:phytoene/squalene synthase family protein [Crocinitomicaceae bacterium]MDG1036358.1 phytoene/squalene synthase family protein [Crocinitomicaceae bacterium]MDG1742443.1 phytoene/squalene synthase family protein [Crocinitomicaceae bacterium]
MKLLFDDYSRKASRHVTKKYSTSFYAGVRALDKKIRDDVHAIYGFVRFADEIVDSFHGFDKAELLEEFKNDTYKAIDRKVSLNPILNSFQTTIHKYNIDLKLIEQFLFSMAMDLEDIEYDKQKYEQYILGSAEVVGLMCLKIFVYGDEGEYEKLKPYAMKLGSSFQKINFLRDLNADFNELGRIYFPNLESGELTLENKIQIEEEIQQEFEDALIGIKMLPKSSRFGVYVSYKYYVKLLKKIQRKTANELLQERIRIANKTKVFVFAKSFLRNSLNIL